MSRRYLDWPLRLELFAADHVGREFAWGLTDCGSLVRRAALAMYEVTPAWELAAFHNRREARQVVTTWRTEAGLMGWVGAVPLGVDGVIDGDVFRWHRPVPTGSWGIVIGDTVLTSQEGGTVVRVPLLMAKRHQRAGLSCWRLP
jgi:hypothetical protein